MMQGKPFLARPGAVVQGLRAALALFVMSPHSAAIADGPNILPVPVITIYPGDVIKDDWLADRDFPAARGTSNSTVVTSRAAIAGKIARRTLLPGSPIPLSAVAYPKLVANGAKVRLVFEEGPLAITAYGIALQAGSAGDVIPVRNLASGMTVSGTVQADGSIRVGGT
jgi:flagella basal body P-ring formation protein FlgA